MRLTWRLRPSWIVSSSVSGVTRVTSRRRGEPVVELDAGAQRADARVADGRPGDDGAVGLRHLEARVREAMGELAVVGEQDQAGGVDVETAHRVQAGVARHERDDRRAALRVAGGRDHAARLVDRVDDMPGGASSARPSTSIASSGSTSRAGSSSTAPSTATRPARTISSAARREATPDVARYLARRIACHHRQHGHDVAGAPARRARAAALPHRPDLEVGGAGRRRLLLDDRPAAQPARESGGRDPVLDPDARARGPRPRRHGQGAVHDRTTAGRSRRC